MVAASEPKVTSKRQKPIGRGHAPEIDLATRAQARNLYAIRRLGGEEVAKQTGLTVRQIHSLAHREGWTQLRAKTKEREERLALARDEADVKEMVDAVAVKNKVLTLGTLDAGIEELRSGGEFMAKNLQALSVAAKNFNGMWREAKALDVSEASQGGTQVNVMFVGALPRSTERTTVNVTPAVPAATQGSATCIDVPATVSPSPAVPVVSVQPVA